MRYNTKRHEIEIGHTVMDYITFGEGEKVLVLIPGLSFKTVRKFAEAFSFMYRIFAKDYTVYVFDRKRQLPIGYTIKNMADDLAHVMTSIGIERADVIGISQGGMIAQYLTLDHPQLVNKLVLGVTLSRLNDTARNVIGNWVRLAVNRDYEGITEDMLKIVYSDAYVARIGKYFPLVSRFCGCPSRYIPAEIRVGHPRLFIPDFLYLCELCGGTSAICSGYTQAEV